MRRKNIYIYKIKDENGDVINFTGTLADFMKEREEYCFGKFTEGKRKALQATLKRGSSYKGFTVLSVEKIKVEKITKEHVVTRDEVPKSNNDGMFILKSKSRKIEIEREIVRKMLHLYCTRKLTLNETSNQLGLLREEVIFVLRKFKITKDSVPFIPEDIETMSVEEMAEIVRLEKKRGFKGKLENNKHIDQEKELKKLHTKQHYFDRFVEAVKEIKSIEIKMSPEMTIPLEELSDVVMVATLTDTHFGVKTDSIFNSFNRHVAVDRMDEYADHIIQMARESKPKKIIVEGLGDYIAGIIHVSNRIETDMDGIVSCQTFVKAVANLLVKVRCETGITVEFTSVHGNHDRIVESKNESLEKETFERFMVWALDLIVKNTRIDRIKVNIENEIFGLSLIKMFDYHIAGHHGHNIKDQNKMVNALNNEGYNIKEIHMGHFHQLKMMQLGKIDVITCPSFVGTDGYATKMMLVNKPMQMIHLYNKDGRFKTEYIRFSK